MEPDNVSFWFVVNVPVIFFISISFAPGVKSVVTIPVAVPIVFPSSSICVCVIFSPAVIETFAVYVNFVVLTHSFVYAPDDQAVPVEI